LEGYEKRLRFLEANTDINNPETIKSFIAKQPTWGNAYKESMVNAYLHYVELNNLQWIKPKYSRPERLPNVPQTEQVNKIIASSGDKFSKIFSILRDSGLRPIELQRSKDKNYDLTIGLISPETAKHGNARIIKLPEQTLALLKDYISQYGYNFPTTEAMTHMWDRTRNRIAKKLKEPDLLKYRLYDLRHYYATMLYAKTKDIHLVKQQLGHKRIEHTLIYTHLINFKTDEYVSKAVQILGNPNFLNEICQLAESGFSLFTKTEEYQIFRKPK
jgi:integrase